jgi:hypothetical protein
MRIKKIRIILTFVIFCPFVFWACDGQDDEGADSSALGDISLTEPANGVENVSTVPTFRWTCENAVKYNLELSQDEEFDPDDVSTYTRKNLTNNQFKYVDELEFGARYYWRVTAFSESEEKKTSDTAGFTVIEDKGLKLSVIQKSIITSANVQGTYIIPPGGTNVKVLICPNKNFASADTKEFNCNNDGTFSFPKTNLFSGKNYFKLKAAYSGIIFESVEEVAAENYETFCIDFNNPPGNGNIFTGITYVSKGSYFTDTIEDSRIKITCNPMPGATAYLVLNFTMSGTGKEFNQIKGIYFNVQTDFLLTNLLAKTRDDGPYVDKTTGAMTAANEVKEFLFEIALPTATGANSRISFCPNTNSADSGNIWIGDVYLLF